MRIIDVHAHIIPENIPGYPKAMKADEREVKRRALRSGITDSVILLIAEYPVPRSVVDKYVERIAADDHFYAMAGFAPTKPETWDFAAELLQQPKFVGLKCHPGHGQYNFREHADDIFGFAQQHKVPVLTHGQVYSWCCDPVECVEAANRYPDVNLIIAHLGLSTAHLTSDRHIEAVRLAKHGNVFIDCSFINTLYDGLIEKTVRTVGSERLLFGTDSPLHHTSVFVESVRTADISDTDKENIFHRNTERVLGI